MSYYFKNDQFVIEDYDKKKPFSSFLPGISGLKGIPLWAFYANRGQGMTSFGIQDKNQPILEFFPANTSYQYVDKYGFRSFVKIEDEIYEPFSVGTEDDVKRNMFISRGHFTIEEINKTKNIHYKVTYFGLVNAPMAGLVRVVDVTNLGDDRMVEVVDGIANILPSGASNENYKNMSNLMVSWMAVENLENNLPFYKFRASSGDEAEISMETKGHFYLSFLEDEELVKPIVDLELVFGYDTSLSLPVGLKNNKLEELDLHHQVVVNKVPCGFTPASKFILSGKSMTINTIIGHVSEVSLINEISQEMTSKAFIDKKFLEAEKVIDVLIDAVNTQSNFALFDAYVKQTFLDNTLRGGYPLVFGKGEKQKVYHVYSRKHGDPERDYNFFTLSPEFYSQGNGNFRDVNQNRRNDVFFVPEAGLFNIRMFMSLIQLDGYNPLSVQGTTFTVTDVVADKLVAQYVINNQEALKKVLSGKFTPGKISMEILSREIALSIPEASFIDLLLAESMQHVEAVYGEGYWSDHWTYNFDLIESYLSLYPDKKEALIYQDKSYQYYHSPASVLPRSMKYGLNTEGEVRQYGAILEKTDQDHSPWIKMPNDQIYCTHLAQKLLTLIMTKFTTLDPFGMGIEMEANKPGWNDAMNGLPGVFGSGLSETVELVRVVRFLKENIYNDFDVLEENYQLFTDIEKVLSMDLSLFDRWENLSTIRERFRTSIGQGISAKEKTVSKNALSKFLKQIEEVLLDGIQRAKDLNKGIIPTYLTYHVRDYEVLDYMTPYGLRAVSVKAFELVRIPNFLEAPARSLKIGSYTENQTLYQHVKKSPLYDVDLKTYKTSEPLDHMSYELGRIRAFTPGWLERESNFLHMTYKFLLGLLEGGLYDAFFEEIKTNLVCFMDPNVYGRSTLENSSFIASSLNPNPNVRGRGFVARLSGSTSEMLSMWQLMMFGKNVFKYSEVLSFEPEPILHADFFKEGFVKTTLLSKIAFVIENKTGLSTYSEGAVVDYFVIDGERVTEVRGEMAHKIRNCDVKEVVMVYKKDEVMK